jgi:uncharacterized membrane protein
MVKIKRWLIHTFIPPWRWRLAFPAPLLNDIEAAIKQSEKLHRGELRFAIENALPPSRIWQNHSARQRAAEVFSNLRVWDTEENSGILVYVLLADREVQIIADRGIARMVHQLEWDAIAATMKTAFGESDFRRGSLEGIDKLTQLLARHFPPGGDRNPNELADKPVIIKR